MHVIVNCVFSYAGCKVQLPHKDMPAHMAAAENVDAHLRLLGAHTQKLSADIASNGALIEMLNFKTWLVIVALAVIIAAVTSCTPESNTHAQCGYFFGNGCVGLTQTMSTTLVVGSVVLFLLLF